MEGPRPDFKFEAYDCDAMVDCEEMREEWDARWGVRGVGCSSFGVSTALSKELRGEEDSGIADRPDEAVLAAVRPGGIANDDVEDDAVVGGPESYSV